MELQWDFKTRNPKGISVLDLISRVFSISVEDVFGRGSLRSSLQSSLSVKQQFSARFQSAPSTTPGDMGCGGLVRQHSVKRAIRLWFRTLS